MSFFGVQTNQIKKKVNWQKKNFSKKVILFQNSKTQMTFVHTVFSKFYFDQIQQFEYSFLKEYFFLKFILKLYLCL